MHGRSALLAFGTIALLFSLNAWSLLTQRFPREIILEVVRAYLDTTILGSIDATVPLFLPLDSADTGQSKRYVLLTAKDLSRAKETAL